MEYLTADFDYYLPKNLIANKPANPKEASRLLDCREQKNIVDRKINDLPKILKKNDLLVVNNSKVIFSHLVGFINSRQVSVNLFKKEGTHIWRAFSKPSKRFKLKTIIYFGEFLSAEVIKKNDGGEVLLKFIFKGDFSKILNKYGKVPLPPYIKKEITNHKEEMLNYQTVFAKVSGSFASPTAGLHFSEKLINNLKNKGINFAEVTLHVGAGTFLPVKTKNIVDHKMHSEWGSISKKTIDKITNAKKTGGRIISVGTTTLRIIESAFQNEKTLRPFEGETDLFIKPGYKFHLFDFLLTNFHLPQSTLIMLVSAFSGRDFVLEAYQHAIRKEYRFFSYGDACLFSCHSRNKSYE